MIKTTDSIIPSNDMNSFVKYLIHMLMRLTIMYTYKENESDMLYILPSLLPEYGEETTNDPIEMGPKMGWVLPTFSRRCVDGSGRYISLNFGECSSNI